MSGYEDLLPGRNYPELTWGTKVDGSPLVIAAQFRAGIRIVNGDIHLPVGERPYGVPEAKELAKGLQEACDWITGDLSLAVEKFYAQRLAGAPESAPEIRRPVKTRIAVTKTAPLRELTWHPENDRHDARPPRPWVADDMQHPYRYSEDDVVELTDVDMMKVSKYSLREVVDFMNAEEYATVIDEWPTTFRADLRNPGGGTVRLEWNTYVWKMPDGRCYVLGHGETTFKTWAPEVQPS